MTIIYEKITSLIFLFLIIQDPNFVCPLPYFNKERKKGKIIYIRQFLEFLVCTSFETLFKISFWLF